MCQPNSFFATSDEHFVMDQLSHSIYRVSNCCL